MTKYHLRSIFVIVTLNLLLYISYIFKIFMHHPHEINIYLIHIVYLNSSVLVNISVDLSNVGTSGAFNNNFLYILQMKCKIAKLLNFFISLLSYISNVKAVFIH